MITKLELDNLVDKYETIDFIKDEPIAITFIFKFTKKALL